MRREKFEIERERGVMRKAEGIQWEEGWGQIESKIVELFAALENGTPPQMTAAEYIGVYEYHNFSSLSLEFFPVVLFLVVSISNGSARVSGISFFVSSSAIWVSFLSFYLIILFKSLSLSLSLSLCRLIYNMCVQHRPCEHSEALYAGYKHIISSYYVSKVLPALMEKCNEFLLKEFVMRWANHKKLIRWLSNLFEYLDRYFVVRRALPTLRNAAEQIFFDVVYEKVKGQMREVILSMIHREREGVQIDENLLRKIVAIYFDMDRKTIKCYKEDFEDAILRYTAIYYRQKALTWIMAHSYADYMRKAYESVKQEEERALRYLHLHSRQKFLETVQHELFAVYARQLEEKKQHEEALIQGLLPKYASLAIS